MTDSNPESWRTFCAIELPEEICARATQRINDLKLSFPNSNASWNRDGRYHLTLKFIGEIPQSRVKRLSLAASRAVAELSPFAIVVEQSGVFPAHGPPRILWIGVNDISGSLTELHARLEDECSREGFPKEDRPYHPHLTLARLRKPQGARSLASAHRELWFGPTEVRVSELLVIRSELSTVGSKYSVISRHQL